jgi:hypothetical protein
VKKIRCRPCRNRDEQARYRQQHETVRKLNSTAKDNGVHDKESYSLRNNGQIWKFTERDNGKWQHMADWELPPSSAATPETPQTQDVGNQM